MKLGADSKQIAAAAILLPLAAYMVYTNILSGGPSAPASSAPARAGQMPQKLKTIDLAQNSALATAGGGPRGAPPQVSRSAGPPRRGGSSQEWTPRVGGRRPEDRADPAKTDPTLKLDLLARLQKVPIAAGGRSLFDFSATPVEPPKVPDVKIDLKKNPKGGPQQAEAAKPPEPPPASAGPPSDPTAPPIPLKFYGFVQGQGGKRAFFRLGEEDIFVAAEGQMVQGRYKIVRIGLSSAVVEDTQFKGNNQQSLRIEEIPKEGL